MNVVPALRQLRTERGRENAAAPDQRITGDPNLERSRIFPFLEKADRGGQLRQALHEHVVGRVKRLRMFDPGLDPEEPRPRRLQIDVAPGAKLGLMAFH